MLAYTNIMCHFRGVLRVVVLLFACPVGLSPACASSESVRPSAVGSRVGVVDYDRVLSAATPFVHAAKVFNEKRDQFYTELGELEKSLSAENKKLMSLRKSDPQKFPAAQEVFEKKLKAAHEKLAARKKTLVAVAEKEQGHAHALFQKALKRVAEANNVQVILPVNVMSTTLVLYNDEKLDLTNQVIAILGTKEK